MRRLVVARFGEMDLAKWWNTRGQLGRLGAAALRRGFPRTHRFAQARSVFAVAAHRCTEVFEPPGCVTLWRLPEAVRLDQRRERPGEHQAPALARYRDWDRCERVAAAAARLLEKQKASLETVFAVVHSRASIRKVAAILDGDRDTRPYLKSLRKAVESSSIGTREQRDALLEDW